jgi:hypothetical protein
MSINYDLKDTTNIILGIPNPYINVSKLQRLDHKKHMDFLYLHGPLSWDKQYVKAPAKKSYIDKMIALHRVDNPLIEAQTYIAKLENALDNNQRMLNNIEDERNASSDSHETSKRYNKRVARITSYSIECVQKIMSKLLYVKNRISVSIYKKMLSIYIINCRIRKLRK